MLTLVDSSSWPSDPSRVRVFVAPYQISYLVKYILARYHDYKRRNITLYRVTLELSTEIHQELSIIESFS